MPILAKNPRALYDYDIKDTFDAGLILTGPEVKATKQGNVSLKGSYVNVDTLGAYLLNCHIGPYQYAKNQGYDPTHTRKLLLTKAEIRSLLGKEKGLVIVPLEIYQGRRGLLKIKIGLGRGRKKRDKREYLKNKDTKKEIRKYV